MSPVVRLHPSVVDDLHSIVTYLSNDNPAIGKRFSTAVQEALTGLSQMPGKGSPRRFRNRNLAGIRSWLIPRFRNYLIFYRPISDGIYVLEVVHGARRLTSILKNREQPLQP